MSRDDGRLRRTTWPLTLSLLSVLDPIPTKHLTSADVTSLAERTREVMLAALIEMGNAGKPTARSSASNGAAAGAETEVTPLLAPSAVDGAASTSTSTPTLAEVAAAPRGGARSEGETDDDDVVHVSH